MASVWSRAWSRIARSFGYPDTGFHGDRILRRLARDLVNSGSVTSFVETGTYLGDTALCVSRMNMGLPVFSCEINERYYDIARRRLAGRANVHIVHEASRDFLPRVLEDRSCGNRPLFLLDAHWYDDWPLAEEIRIITGRLTECIIIIDDFRVPGKPQFQFDLGGGGGKRFSGRTTLDQRACDLDLIRPALDRRHCYRAWLPSYARADAFPGPPLAASLFPLRGYVVIEQNSDGGAGSAVQALIPASFYTSQDISG